MRITKRNLNKLIREYLEDNAIVFTANPDDTVEREIKVVDGVYYDSIAGQWDEITDTDMIKYLDEMGSDDSFNLPGDEDASDQETGIDLKTGEDHATPDHLKQQEPTEAFLMEILLEVLGKTASGKKTKDWTDLDPLDGGTVGIAHFNNDGMWGLYAAMNDDVVERYFAPYNDKITTVEALKAATRTGKNRFGPTYCRKGSKKAVEGTCWASMPWWRKGMKDFLESPESKKIQFQGWLYTTVGPANEHIDKYKSIDPRWGTARGRAIAYSLTNSSKDFVPRFSKNGKLSPNDTMEAYSKAIPKRVRSRMRIIDRLYPDPDFKPTFKPKDWPSSRKKS